MDPLVDVLITTIGRPSLAQAILAAQLQTYSPLRIIVAEDGPHETTPPILAMYQNNSRVIHVMPPKAFGFGDGVKHWWVNHPDAAPFIKFLDDDDWITPSCVATMMRNMTDALALVTCSVVCVYAPDAFATRSRIIIGNISPGQIGSGCVLLRTQVARGIAWPRVPDSDYHFFSAVAENAAKADRQVWRAIKMPLYFYNAYRTNSARGYDK